MLFESLRHYDFDKCTMYGVRTLIDIDTSQNKVVCYDENEGSYTERDIRNTINNTKVKLKMIYSIKIK